MNVATWFEIPVTDMQRAKAFYADIMASQLNEDTMTMPDGNPYTMAVFDAAEGAVSGMLVHGKGYVPSPEAAVIYLHGGMDLDGRMRDIENAGGKIVVPKTPVCDGTKGYFCQFIDTEGNRVGLYSPPQ